MKDLMKLELMNMNEKQFKTYSRACTKWQARLAKLYVLSFN
jgi:hypothetical protein